jgi:hypothetical protein
MSSFNMARSSVPKEFNMKNIQGIYDKEYQDISREVDIKLGRREQT